MRQVLDEVLRRWVDGETRGDRAVLAPLLADDYAGVGPHGFELDRSQWLARFDAQFEVQELRLEGARTRDLGDCALVLAEQVQRASYRGFRSDGRYRLALVCRPGEEADWRVEYAQLSGPLPTAPADRADR